uniref:putative receptor-like protein kinase At3g47110 n=1 Tax=Erigeron canadensis TaxID=72917 RepID=UPI001CB91947|nr:putative receptor-like protein kinase At3g47110 [Erigeron canadensis]
MEDNYFTGNLPKSIGNLESLLELGLDENRLQGHIPPNLGNCRGLLALDLSINNLTGPIPVEIFQLSSLSITLNLSHNYLLGPLPHEIEKLKSLTKLDLSHNDLVGEIPNAISSSTSLEYLNLGANSFHGPIPTSMSALRGIMDLNLSGNNFSGRIPKFLEQLNLSSLDLSFNNLDGEVPLEGIFKNVSLISIQGNNGLCGGLPELRLPKCVIVSGSKIGSRTSRVILIVIPICSLFVVAMVLSYLYYWKRRNPQVQPAEASYVQPFSRVSYGSILRATNEFSQQSLIGTGAFSAVYKGILEPGDGMVAIKVLKLGNQGALKSFVMECEALKNIRHRNLVKLVTSCSSVDFQGNDFKALIYEFMPNGNLERWLHPNSEQDFNIEEAPHPQRLTLRQIVTIATEVAHAMHYLHQECEVPIIHCDMKPSNILLDNDMVAHIGDFGLAKFLPLNPHESSSAGLRGTIGYAPPEYGLGNEMTKEGDIYSFGILLLEIITGKRPTDCIFQQGLNLHGYVMMALPDRLMEIIEPSLLCVIEGANVKHKDEARKWKMLEKSMILLTRTGLACSFESPKDRMNTSQIIQELHHINGLFLALLLWSPTLSLATNHTDHLALLAIKSSIIHDPQHVLDSWNTSFHFCQWQGVTCGHRHPRVTMLDLGSQGFAGSLSPHIGNLSFLRVIRLRNNTFKGVIPLQLGNLFRLKLLFLDSNSFEGKVPASLSNCTELNALWLSFNNLVGRLPQQLSTLVNLTVLAIHNNGFTGGIPSFFGNFTSLTALSATNNNLSGSIPHTLDNLISGSLPKDIGLQLPNLVSIYIWRNKFTGSIPLSFSNCSNLFRLELNDNGFTGKFNIDFRRMPNLQSVVLGSNSLGSSEPDEMNFIDSMVNCTKLDMLDVFNNKLTGVLPSSIGNFSSQLTTLKLAYNFIYGNLPSGIGNLVKLERLNIASNHFTGIVPSELGNLQNLKYLYMYDNLFNGNFPNFIGNLQSLLELFLNENRLGGNIPPNLSNNSRLLSLDLSTNNLTGPIPVELFQLPSLSIYLGLSHNYLVGPLPQEIEKLKMLSALDLSHNDLVGPIPNAIASCISLEYLDLSANSFQGPIPPSISFLRGITYLDLSNNNFSEQIPKFLEKLNLSALDLSFNNLDGEVPLGGIFKNVSLISIQGNNRLCGGLPEFHLPKCAIVSRSKTGSRSRVLLTIIPICSILVVAMILFNLFYWKRRKAQAQPAEEASYVQPFSRISYESILRATNEFSQQNLIGTGAFSAVYKGILELADGMVAIKVLKLRNHGALKSFVMECEALKNIRHRNLVKVITSCSSVDFQGNDFKALIYEFMPNGNLERWLHPSSEQEVDIEKAPPNRLTLCQRVTTAIDVAHAMHYLHQECEVPIIHCDLKPSNILLDSDMVAHIGDFGLAKFLPLKPHESSTVGLRGTIGYAAPEYGLGGEMTKEGDIYSFGILLLEMITGKRPTDHIFQNGLNLHGYVTMAFPDRLMEITEPTLSSVIEGAIVSHGDEATKWERLEEIMILLARIGLACSMESPKERMNSSKIIQELHHINGLI